MNIQPSRMQGIFEMQRGRFKNLLTKNLVPGRQVYGERLFHLDGVEYREWDPDSSKICSALHQGLSQIGLKPGDVALYLGCSTGTTVSHISDIIGESGFVFAVDLAPRVLRELVFVSEERPNMAPILCDANRINLLAKSVCQVDWLFQDIAQRDQLGIFQKNVETFLKPGGFGLLAVKARSVNVAQSPKQIFMMVKAELEKTLTIVDYRELEPFQKDHALFVVKKRLPGEPAAPRPQSQGIAQSQGSPQSRDSAPRQFGAPNANAPGGRWVPQGPPRSGQGQSQSQNGERKMSNAERKRMRNRR